MRYIVHAFLYGLYAALEAQELYFSKEQMAHGVVVFQNDLVYDLTEAARSAGIRLGMKRSTVERMASQSMMIEYDHMRLRDRLQPLWREIWHHTPWVETDERELFFALSGQDPRKELRQITLTLQQLFPIDGWRLCGGMGSNKLIAKMATRAAYRRELRGMPILRLSPHAFLLVLDEKKWMETARIEDIWRLPQDARMRMRDLGIRYVKELLSFPDGDLQLHFGKEAVFWQAYARGEDYGSIKVNFPPVVREIHWRGRGETVPREALPRLLRRMAEILAARLEAEGAGAERLLLRASGYRRSGLCEEREELDVSLAKLAATADQIWRQVEKQIERLVFESVSVLSMALGELRPLALQQLSWGIFGDALCDPSWSKNADAKRVCEELQQRFSKAAIRRGCCLPSREWRLSQVDPFRGGHPV